MSSGAKARRRLSPERIVETALRVADEEGLDALSLRRLAGLLDVTPMSIYRHVRNKSHLLDLMAESLFEQLDLASAEEATWQDRMRRLLGSYQAIVTAHPSMPVVISRPLVAPAQLRVTEALLAILNAAGFQPSQSALLVQVLAGMLVGPAIHRATWLHAEEQSPEAASDSAQMEALMAGDFPNFAVVAPLMDWTWGGVDQITLDLLMGGLEALAAQQDTDRDLSSRRTARQSPASRSKKGR
jgi:AcrR family transcriptional regulator